MVIKRIDCEDVGDNDGFYECYKPIESEFSPLLYTVGVNLKMVIHWNSPPKCTKEKQQREIFKQNMDYKAQLFAHEMVMKINKNRKSAKRSD